MSNEKAIFPAADETDAPEPKPILPRVTAARERDRLARAALKAGKTLATPEDELQARAWSNRGAWR